MVQVWQGGKIGVRRYGAITGQKSPIFDSSRQIYQENFGQGLHSGRRREAPWGRDPCTLVVPLQKLPHSGEILCLLLLHDRLPGIAGEGRAPSLSSISQTCALSFN